MMWAGRQKVCDRYRACRVYQTLSMLYSGVSQVESRRKTMRRNGDCNGRFAERIL